MATVLVTFAILVFSEATPKVIAATHPERVAVVASYPLTLLLKVAYPVVWFVNLFVQGLIRLLRVQPEPESTQLTPEELRVLVLESGQFIAKKHRSMLLNLFELENCTVDDVMVPRHQLEMIDIDDDLDEIVAQLQLGEVLDDFGRDRRSTDRWRRRQAGGHASRLRTFRSDVAERLEQAIQHDRLSTF